MIKIRILILFYMCLLFIKSGISQQINISRIDQMPNLPSPYEMRNWKQVTLGYDSLVFDFNREGEYLPLISWMTNTVNYPGHPSIYLNTVVGTTVPLNTEAINVIPAVVGASLVGIDKSTQNGHNWALYCEEFFNKRPEENVYLNNPVAQSGDDWWYATMPNVFFYQLNDIYPGTGDFDYQFTSVADQWLKAVITMGGSSAPWTVPDMNYRGWYLSTMTPFEDGVREPESAGAIGWLLYNAYHQTGQKKYRIGAEWALEFLNNRQTNPSYELQLSYGAYIAARMNAELGTEYNMEKIVNWCFNVGPLRQWGAILGRWGVYDVYGLIGEADGTDYAFTMNTFEQIGALVPLIRYDDRFTRAIAKWVLNASNACRLFYPNYLSDLNQDSEEWAHTYDPKSTIAHEAMRQQANGFPYATGDAIDGGWGMTNLALYGSSHVGILGGIIDTTNVVGILQLDLLKTDYYHDQSYPSFVYYNPYTEEKSIEINTGEGTHDLYDAVTNQIIASGVSGTESISLAADAAALIVILPVGGAISYEQDKMLVNDIIVDYRSGQNVDNYPPRIKSLGTTLGTVIINDSITVYCTAVDKDLDPLSYNWEVSDGDISGTGSQVNWIAPSYTGLDTIVCWVEDGKGGEDSSSLIIQTEERINNDPVIHQLTADPRKIDLGQMSEIICTASDPDNDDELTYLWSCKAGSLEFTDSVATWTAPAVAGDYYIVCRVEDNYNGFDLDSINIAVRDLSIKQTGDLVAYYPFDGNANDASTFGNNGIVYGPVLTQDRFGASDNAYLFDGVNDYILVPNSASLNFQSSITVNFWIKITEFYDTREAYPLSHGNWERRWKFSITNQKIRWTVKTDDGIKDIDSDHTLLLNKFYNITGVYNGSDFEIYIDGKLNNFSHHSGLILTTTIDLTIGQVLPDNNNYNFKGIIDDVRIYNYALSLEEIADLYDINLQIPDQTKTAVPLRDHLSQNFPNPFNPKTIINYQLAKGIEVDLSIYNVLGQRIETLVSGRQTAGSYRIEWNAENYPSGIYYYRIEAGDYWDVKKMVVIK